MNLQLGQAWARVRDSFWFLPAMMTLGSMALAELVVNIDERFEVNDLDGLGWLYGGSAEGARAMLAAIAGSLIGVAGTVFSITIAALSLASNQMGPRLLEHFTRDRGNQAALGTFIGTFTFALLVLRTVRSTENEFVPHLAVTLGLVLTLSSLGVLIYFIHHISSGINVSRVIQLVSQDLERSISRHFVARSAQQTADRRDESLPQDFDERATILRAEHGGYLQTVDVGALLKLSVRHDVIVRLLVRPGSFVFHGAPIAQIYPQAVARDELLQTLVVGTRRTSPQDVELAVRQLVEVAVRALSPGINDPFTVLTVLDHLGNALCRVAEKVPPPAVHFCNRKIRVVIPVTDFDGLTDAMFHQIRQNGASHPAVMIRLLEVLAVAIEQFGDSREQSTLHRHASLARTAGMQGAQLSADQHDIEERYTRFLAALNQASASRGPRKQAR
ncbi:DUF2254 domain-containing protein [Deinococcus peraridilitoris]|uniref:Putative membrane protein n=1 Tax=Deinococcus peraridilitoris (strain DSM 19664 / LMG 22246 / CIP 109416 / KR-200) TaxID=937777 RepID=L0A2M5_DEIPD|nr:DUF2254 domain-containing protein [Deinococcus peraridilitoris]AFZ67694.1 putative membrane protein [Deinococcus peraridilitoris DSM 19664]